MNGLHVEGDRYILLNYVMVLSRMSGEIYTYPIIGKIDDFVLDELVHYNAYKHFKELQGEKVDINVVVYDLRDEDIKKIKSIGDFKIVDAENYFENLHNYIGDLLDEGKLLVKKKRVFYCENCNTHYSPTDINYEEKEEENLIVRVRIGKRVYFVDKIQSDDEPIGVKINDKDKLITVKMDRETWIAPQSMRDIWIKNIEIPEKEIKTISTENLKKKVKLTTYVITGNIDTGFIVKREEDLYDLKRLIPSYTVIYSVKTKRSVPICPRCGNELKIQENPYLYLRGEKENIRIGTTESGIKIPLLYCDSCGHMEFGLKIKDCPICGNVMEIPFFYELHILPLGAYSHIKSPQEVAFIHQKRLKLMQITDILKLIGVETSKKNIILRQQGGVGDIFHSLLQKRGKFETVKKIDKLKNTLQNLVKYINIYGKSGVRDQLDQWILHRLEEVKKKVMDSYSKGNFADAFQTIYNFVVLDLSRFYVVIRRREPIVFKSVADSIRLLYPLSPQFSKSLLESLGESDMKIKFEETADVKDIKVFKSVIKSIIRFREKEGIPKREPLKKVVFVSDHANIVRELSSMAMKYANILVFVATEKWDEMELTIEPNVNAISRMYRAWAPKIAFLLKRKNPKDIMSALMKGGYTMGIEGFIIKITPDMVNYVEKVPKGYIKIPCHYGALYVNSKRDASTSRIRLSWEVIRRINWMRKDLDLEYDDVIDVAIATEGYPMRVLKSYVEEIKERTRARSVDFKYMEYAYVVEWPIMNYDITIGINPLFKKWVIKAFQSIPGIAESKAELLFHMGYGSIYELMQTPPSELAEIPGFSLNFANRIHDYIYKTAFKPKKKGDKEYCPFCGAELSKEDDFCPKCGAPIRIKIEKKEIEEGNAYVAIGDFSKIVTPVLSRFSDERKLLITKEEPEEIKKEFGLKNVSIIWISYVPIGRSIKPKDLRKLIEEIEKFLGKGGKVVIMDSFDFLNTINGFDVMLNFLKTIREDIKATKSYFFFNVEELEEESMEKLMGFVDGEI